MKKSLEEEVIKFLKTFSLNDLQDFIKIVFPLLELFYKDEHQDWVVDAVGEDNERNVRIIRTVYILSHLAERFAGKFVGINVAHKRLWERIEREAE